MAGPIRIAILANASQATREITATGRSVDNLGGRFSRTGRAARLAGAAVAAGAAIAAAAVVAWGVSSVKSLLRIEKINAQTTQAIKSTGGAAGVTAKHVENLAGKLENLTATEAESTQEGANLLLTFTNIRNGVGKSNKIFDRATSTLVDMSRALGTEPKAAAVQLGKALNDPVKGITALTKVGVSFTEGQKNTIKSLVDSGKTMKAQKIILGELNKEFGGSGKAYAKTTQGQIDLAQHAFGTLGETIFAALLPPLAKAATATANFLNDLSTKVGPAYDKVQKVLGPTIDRFKEFFGTLGGGSAIVQPLLDVFQTYASTVQTQVLPALLTLGSYVAATLGPILAQVGTIVVTKVLPTVVALATFFYGTLYPAVVKIAAKIATNLKPVFDQYAATVQTKVLPAIGRLLDKFEQYRPTIQRVILAVVKIIGKVAEFASVVLAKVLPVLIRFQGFLIGKQVAAIIAVVDAIATVVRKLIDFGGAVRDAAGKVADFAAKVKNKIDSVVNVFTKMGDKIKGAITNPLGLLKTIGGQIIDGLLAGLREAGEKIAGVVQGIIDKIPNFIKKRMGIASPSKVTKKLGAFITAGLIAGLESGGPGLERALDTITSSIEKILGKRFKGKELKAQIARVLKGLADEYRALTKNAKAQQKVNDALEAARSKLRAVRAESNAYAASIKDSFKSFGSVVGLGVQEDGTVALDGVLGNLKDKLVKAQRFAALIRKLIKGKLNKTTLQQLLEAGPEAGLATAEAIASGGKDAISEINSLTAQIAAQGGALGDKAANTMYGAGIQAAQGLVAGLLKDKKRLEKVARLLAQALIKAVKKALDINSPSRVFKEMGRQTALGLTLGLDQVDVRRAGTLMARDLSTGFGTPALAAYAARGGNTSSRIDINLSADTVSDLQQGKRARVTVDGWASAGGRITK